MHKFSFTFLIIGSLVGCSALPVATSQPVALGSNFAADRTALVCVLVPPDASFEGEVYAGSGREIAEKVRNVLEGVGRPSLLVSQAQGERDSACRDVEASLVLKATIVHYEDRVTGWSGKPDRVELNLALYKIDQPDQKRSVFYEARSSIAHSAFFEWGNAKPSALLKEDFEYVVGKLLRQTIE